MGGRGSSSGLIRANKNTAQANQPSQVSQQAPDASNTPVTQDAISKLSDMTDAQLAALVAASKTADMPNMLSDVDDATQKFVYTAGLNEKPTVLDDAAFNQFMRDNNIAQSDVLARSVDDITYTNNDGTRVRMSADRVSRLLKDSKLNYIGGKHGGQALGAGTYFDQNGGSNTGYGTRTITAVLNPKTARIITKSALKTQAQAFAASHPGFAKAVGDYNKAFSGGSNNMSIYALAMGYNVIKNDWGGYHNVIDRSALVIRKKDR